MTPNCCVRTRPVPPQSAYDNSLCRDAMEIVMESYGAEVGNSAIKFMPFGGLYIAGGIAMKNLSHIQARAPSQKQARFSSSEKHDPFHLPCTFLSRRACTVGGGMIAPSRRLFEKCATSSQQPVWLKTTVCDLPPDPRAQGEDTPFMRAYRDRGRIKPLLRKVPLRLVTVDDLGLRGSHYVALAECVVRGIGGGVAASRVAVARVDRRAHNRAPSSLVDF